MMAIIKCKMCGGELALQQGSSVAECEYCGSVQTVPTADSEKKLNLFARANRLRAACEFDKAAVVYESIAAEFPEEAEAYWGLVLCKYGIEYVDDPATGKKIPTCHRSSFDSVMKDGNFELAQEYADVIARRVYREEAKTIEGIRAGILEVSAKEAPYDVFICYKETDFDSNRTLDSVLAQDLYSALTDKGYRVFFARISLEDKLGQQYEPYIFAALNSAKVMLVVGTDYEHFNAVWVKNEWSRFLKLMTQDKSKHLIPCFKGIDAYDMPEEFARLQGQDLGKMGATQDILHGMEKLIPRQTQVKETVVVQTPGVNVDARLKRGQMALEDGLWDKAEGFFDEVLNHDAECARAYLGLAMAEAHTAVVRSFVFKNIQSAHYQRAKQFADPALLAELTGLEKEAADFREAERQRAEEERRRQEEERRRQAELEAARLAEEKARQEEEDRVRREAIRAKREEEQRAREARIPILAKRREEIAPAQNMLAIPGHIGVALRSDGTLITAGDHPNFKFNVVSRWSDVTAISCAVAHVVALRADGTVLATGTNTDGECNVQSWTNIVAIAADYEHTIGLRSDGTVVATGGNTYGQINIEKWTDIIAIATRMSKTYGLRSDGTVISTTRRNETEQLNWRNIVAISAGSDHVVGLKNDGTVVAIGNQNDAQCKVEDWTDIVAISAGNNYTLGLKADGTVVAVGDNSCHQCRGPRKWQDIVAIYAGRDFSSGLKSDGTIVCSYAGPFEHYKQVRDTMNGKKLFHSCEHLSEEKRILTLENSRKAQGLCRHCGGDLKGLLTKKCVSCGKAKDY